MPNPTDAERIEAIATTLGTLISWVAQASNSPISRDEAASLLQMLNSAKPPAPSILLEPITCTCCGSSHLQGEPLPCRCWKRETGACHTCGKCQDHCICAPKDRRWKGGTKLLARGK